MPLLSGRDSGLWLRVPSGYTSKPWQGLLAKKSVSILLKAVKFRPLAFRFMKTTALLQPIMGHQPERKGKSDGKGKVCDMDGTNKGMMNGWIRIKIL